MIWCCLSHSSCRRSHQLERALALAVGHVVVAPAAPCGDDLLHLFLALVPHAQAIHVSSRSQWLRQLTQLQDSPVNGLQGQSRASPQTESLFDKGQPSLPSARQAQSVACRGSQLQSTWATTHTVQLRRSLTMTRAARELPAMAAAQAVLLKRAHGQRHWLGLDYAVAGKPP